MFSNICIGLILVWLACGCSHLQPTSHQGRLTATADKIAVRNNAASLLLDLLKDEKNVGKVFIIKSANKDVTTLVKLIAATAATHEKELEELATNDPELDLQDTALPPGEVAARKATAKSKEHELLFSRGANFEFNLLMTQAEAENYGWHLAAVAAENSPRPEEAHTFSNISEAMKHLDQQVVERIRTTP